MARFSKYRTISRLNNKKQCNKCLHAHLSCWNIFSTFSKCVTLHYIGTTDFEISSFYVALKIWSHLFLFVLFLGVHQLGQSLLGTSQIEEASHRFGSRLPRWAAFGRCCRRGDSGQSDWFNKKTENTATNGKLFSMELIFKCI